MFVAAYLAAYVALPAQRAFVDHVDELVADLAAAVDKRHEGDHTAPARVSVEVPVVDAGASLCETPSS